MSNTINEKIYSTGASSDGIEQSRRFFNESLLEPDEEIKHKKKISFTYIENEEKHVGDTDHHKKMSSMKPILNKNRGNVLHSQDLVKSDTNRTGVKPKDQPTYSSTSIVNEPIKLNHAKSVPSTSRPRSKCVARRRTIGSTYTNFSFKKRVTLNVGGIRYQTYTSTLKLISESRLANLNETNSDYDPINDEYFFDRHPGAFMAILNFFRTGKLHAPTDLCVNLFSEELNFWGINELSLEPCCWNNFSSQRDANNTLAKILDKTDINSEVHGIFENS